MKEEDLLGWTISTINRFGIKPKQRLGQNYVVDHGLIECLIDVAEIEPNEVVLEIGAGIGTLTLRLAKKARKVIAVEVDKNAAKVLSSTMSGRDNVEIVIGDILELEIPKVDKIVSNLPFSISTPVTFKILRDCSFKLAALTYQKEVAEKLLAKPGESEYSRLSVVTSLLAEVRRVRDFPPEAFYPKPKVFSTVITISKKVCDLVDWANLEETLKILFSQRRRKLKKAIEIYCKIKGLDPIDVVRRVDEKFLARRVFELEPNDFIYLSRAIGGIHAKSQDHG
ncbi:MAG: 16S rRNA (adenine(1518)-N(6)/adenine(1519)-N(6))-dimethyltransferase RsmA [Candidatus Methanomethyliaceae archaeon]|nr:16S rRNA (adenine(1518)-N(6)/adenine(1519)-N(6))-dimethyltransferase RsmA [Candidatus Methanomethyliaceae archaeon]